MIISIVNRAASIGDGELQQVLRAINRQIADDFAPYWSFGARLRLEGKVGRSPDKERLGELRGDAVIYLWDQVDVQDALGYHDRNSRGIPYGFVFTELSKQLGEHWSVTLSHEALELLGDAEGNLLVQGPHPNEPEVEVFHWFEMCDAVQAQTYTLDGVEVSNFVLPLYFTAGEERGGRNDFLGARLKGKHKTLPSFGVAPGGYVGFYDPRHRSHETYAPPADKRAFQRQAIKNRNAYGRGYLRKNGEAPLPREQAHQRLLQGKGAIAPGQDPIKHVVVLMLENRSFDHLLGGMSRFNDQVDGVGSPPAHSNVDGKTGAVYRQMPIAFDSLKADLEHEHAGTLRQLAAAPEPDMTGFIDTHRAKYPNAKQADFEQVMAYFPFGDADQPERDALPVLHGLARNFAVCDRWFSSMPGPTWQNRFFVHSGTCLGHVLMPSSRTLQDMRVYYQDTLYDRLDDAKLKWRIYHDDIPQSIVMTRLLGKYLDGSGYDSMDDFFVAAQGEADDFPVYAFIEPNYFGKDENDQHPPADVHRGEQLIAGVYNALRANAKLWESTLLIVTYDEHGRFYDHVPPPAAVPPDRHTGEWSFDRLGVRVPTILVSPWLDAGIVHTDFEHSSILRYVCEKWNLAPLGQRMLETAGPLRANTFAPELLKRSTPRSDTPLKLTPRIVKAAKRAAVEPPIEGAREALLLFVQQLPEPAPVPVKAKSGKRRAALVGEAEKPPALSPEAARDKLRRLRRAAG